MTWHCPHPRFLRHCHLPSVVLHSATKHALQLRAQDSAQDSANGSAQDSKRRRGDGDGAVATCDGDALQTTVAVIEEAPGEVSVATPAVSTAETADMAPDEPVALVAGDAQSTDSGPNDPLDGCKACPPFGRHVRHTCIPGGPSM